MRNPTVSTDSKRKKKRRADSGKPAAAARSRGVKRGTQTTGRHTANERLIGQRRIIEALVSGESLSHALRAITTAVELHHPGVLCSILLLDESRERLTCGAAGSLPKEYANAINNSAVGPNAGACAAAAHRRQPVTVADIATDPLCKEVRSIALRHGLRAWWSHPVASTSGQLLGTFAMHGRESRGPDDAEQQTMRAAASLAATAIERKRSVERLEEINERVQLISKATNDVVWDWDLSNNTLWWNDGMQTLFGYAPQEIEPGIESWSNRIHPQDRDRVAAGVHVVLESGAQVWSDEYRFRRHDGSYAYIYDRGFITRDALGRATRVVGTMVDITPRKQLEEAARESERMFATLLGNLPGAVYRCKNDPAWTTHFISEGIQALTGYPAADLIGNRKIAYGDLVHPEDRAPVWEHIQAALAERRSFEITYRIATADGRLKWVWERGRGIYADDGALLFIEGFLTDISERKRAEEATVQHALQQETVAALGQFALSHRELDRLMARAVTSVARGLGMDYCKILQFDPEERCLLLRAHSAHTPSSTPPLAYLNDAEFLESYCLKRTEAVVTEDFAEERRFTAHAADPTIRSGIAVIIFGASRPYGVLSVCSTTPRRFSADEVNFVQVVANVLAAAIERKEAEQRLAHLAQFDPLTGLPNRNLFRDRLGLVVARAQRDEQLAALLFIDLDRFKAINDTLGHEAGDRVLKDVSARLRSCLRAGDTIARIGGDEFTVILEEMESSAQVRRVAEKILNEFAEPMLVEGKEFIVTPSIGVALYPHDGKDGDSLLKHADIAMYQAKNEGRNNVQFYAAVMSTAASDRVSLERSLRRALERQEFLMYYQPVVDLHTHAVIGLEALLRWQHPEWGLVAPDRFIQLAEQTGLIVPIGEWVLHDVCAQSAKWQQAGFAPIRVAVNLSARQFRKSNLVNAIGDALRASGIPGSLLELEITESLLMESAETSSRLLDRLKTMGLHVALDDFGTGYSSFAYLKHFPLDVVKIDRSFVRDITTDPDDAAIVIGMIELGHSLDLKLTAEGTETKPQVDFLQEHGCDYAQGYLFSRPQPVDRLTQILKDRVIVPPAVTPG